MAISPENMKDGSFTWKRCGFEIDAIVYCRFILYMYMDTISLVFSLNVATASNSEALHVYVQC